MLRRLVVFWAMGILVLAGCNSGTQASGSSGANGSTFNFAPELVTPGTLTIATSGNYPPLSGTRQDGQLEGIDIDLCTQFAVDLGLKPKFIVVDFGGIIPGLATKRWDMACSGLNMNAERMASTDFDFVWPYLVDSVTMAIRASDEGKITGLSSVDGLKWGAVRGSNEESAVTAALDGLGLTLTKVNYPGLAEMLLDLKNGRIDFAAVDSISVTAATKDDSAVMVIDAEGPGIHETPLASAVTRSEPQLAAAINELVIKYRQNGFLGDLQMKWFGSIRLPDVY